MTSIRPEGRTAPGGPRDSSLGFTSGDADLDTVLQCLVAFPVGMILSDGAGARWGGAGTLLYTPQCPGTPAAQARWLGLLWTLPPQGQAASVLRELLPSLARP